jgi:hypothetical protein
MTETVGAALPVALVVVESGQSGSLHKIKNPSDHRMTKLRIRESDIIHMYLGGDCHHSTPARWMPLKLIRLRGRVKPKNVRMDSGFRS